MQQIFPPDTRDRRDIPKYQLEVHRLNHSGYSVLHIIVYNNQIEKVKTYIEFGVEINLESRNKLTPIEIALKNKHEEIAWLLLENGAKLTQQMLKNYQLPDRERFLQRNYQKLEEQLLKVQEENLQRIESKFTYFTELPSIISSLHSLTDITFSYNNLLSFPEILTTLPNINKLDLSNNMLNEIPPSFSNLTSLRFLNLSSNFIGSIDAIIELEFLIEILIGRNQITQIPKQVTNLKRLVKLDVSYNFLTKLPETLTDLIQLKHFDISYNFLSTMDLQVRLMTALAYLDVSGNQIVSCYFHEIMTSVKTFRFAENRFPIDIYRILQCFYEQLSSLDLSCLSLQTMRREITYLTSLKELNLSNNDFTQLPEEIGQLTSLTSLDLSYNRITNLPLFLHRLTLLQELKLEGTRSFITNPPRSIVDKGIRSILGYYSDLLKEGDPCYRMKLMFVGQGNSFLPSSIILLN